MASYSSSFQGVPDTLEWRKMVKAVEGVDDYAELLEAACEAKGYLRCLYDVGLVGMVQRNQMAEQLEEVCAKHLLHAQRSPIQRLDGACPGED